MGNRIYTTRFAAIPDVPNKNGFIYPKEAMLKTFALFKEKCEFWPTILYVGYEEDNVQNIKMLLTKIDIKEEPVSFEGTIEILDTPDGQDFYASLGGLTQEEFADKFSIGCNYAAEELDLENKIIKSATIILVGLFPKEEIEYKQD